MKKLYALLAGICCLLLVCCNPARVVKPLEKGEVRGGASLGGAVIKLGSAPVPLPLTSVWAAKGFTGTTTGFAGLHSTSMLFGVFQADLGITRQIVQQNVFIPGISVSPVANLMFDRWESHFSFYPQVDLNLFWNYGKKQNLVYASLNNWFELRDKRAHDEPQLTTWLPSIGAGHQWNGKKYGWQFELKYLAPTENNNNLVVEYVSFGSSGALGVYFGVNRKF